LQRHGSQEPPRQGQLIYRSASRPRGIRTKSSWRAPLPGFTMLFPAPFARGSLELSFTMAEGVRGDPLRIDPDRGDQHKIVGDVDPVDLHHQEVEAGKVGRQHSRRPPADSATKCRETADFDTPAPAAAGTSPSGRRTARRNFRAETLISMRFIAHWPSQSSATACSQLGSASSRPAKSRTRGRSTIGLLIGLETGSNSVNPQLIDWSFRCGLRAELLGIRLVPLRARTSRLRATSRSTANA
jgi:hypothetical protein